MKINFNEIKQQVSSDYWKFDVLNNKEYDSIRVACKDLFGSSAVSVEEGKILIEAGFDGLCLTCSSNETKIYIESLKSFRFFKALPKEKKAEYLSLYLMGSTRFLDIDCCFKFLQSYADMVDVIKSNEG